MALSVLPIGRQLPNGFERVDFSDENFDRIPRPSNWQLEGYDTPIYTNIRYPYPISTKRGEIPKIDPDRNPVGIYRRRFSLPASFAGRRVFLQLNGANSAAEVFCNGRRAGFCLSSFDPHRFDLTDLLTAGENLLAIRVFRWSTGSYLEDQDMWRLAGLFRDVLLVAEPQAGILDLTVRTRFPDGYDRCRLELEAALPGTLPEGSSLLVALRDPAGAEVLREECPAAAGRNPLAFWVEHPALWSDETPSLYRLAVSLRLGGQEADARGAHHRVAGGADRGGAAAAQRPPDRAARGQPARISPPAAACGERGAQRGGHPAAQTEQSQRAAHQPLPEQRPGL